MRFEWFGSSDALTVAIVPTANPSSHHTASFIQLMNRLGSSVLCVVDRLPMFKFARSLNSGLDEIAALERLECVVLSNDDITEISGYSEMCEFVKSHAKSYAAPFVNQHTPVFTLVRDPVDMLRRQIRQGSASRSLVAFAKTSLRGYPHSARGKRVRVFPLSTRPSRHGWINVQPFAVFPSDIAREWRFDERFSNGVEDFDLAIRLNDAGVKGVTSSKWQVTHLDSKSFRTFWNDEQRLRNRIENWRIFEEIHSGRFPR